MCQVTLIFILGKVSLTAHKALDESQRHPQYSAYSSMWRRTDTWPFAPPRPRLPAPCSSAAGAEERGLGADTEGENGAANSGTGGRVAVCADGAEPA